MITAIPGNQNCTHMDRFGIQARREAQFASNSGNILSNSIYTPYLILYRCFSIVIIISFHLMTYSKPFNHTQQNGQKNSREMWENKGNMGFGECLIRCEEAL